MQLITGNSFFEKGVALVAKDGSQIFGKLEGLRETFLSPTRFTSPFLSRPANMSFSTLLIRLQTKRTFLQEIKTLIVGYKG